MFILHKPNEAIAISREFPLDQIKPKQLKALLFFAYHTDPETMVVWKNVDDLRREIKVSRATAAQMLEELAEDGFVSFDGEVIRFLDNEYIKIPKD